MGEPIQQDAEQQAYEQGYEEAAMCICEGFSKLPFPLALKLHKAFNKWMRFYLKERHPKEYKNEFGEWAT